MKRLNERGKGPTTNTIALIGIVFVLIGQWWTGYDSRRTIVQGQRDGCERGKLDRAANASAFRGQSDYLTLVLDATSVRADVKRAATVNQAIQNAAASSLESRTGANLDCGELFPDPPLIRFP